MLVALMSGRSLVATTGIAAGAMLLASPPSASTISLWIEGIGRITNPVVAQR
ncbi:MAG: hypothetical protein ABI862_05995 [Ilumatobacteraceae bacterium]